MDELATVLLRLGAGLGAFLLGMRHLSEGLQAAKRAPDGTRQNRRVSPRFFLIYYHAQ